MLQVAGNGHACKPKIGVVSIKDECYWSEECFGFKLNEYIHTQEKYQINMFHQEYVNIGDVPNSLQVIQNHQLFKW